MSWVNVAVAVAMLPVSAPLLPELNEQARLVIRSRMINRKVALRLCVVIGASFVK
jgi:hypothetical protein